MPRGLPRGLPTRRHSFTEGSVAHRPTFCVFGTHGCAWGFVGCMGEHEREACGSATVLRLRLARVPVGLLAPLDGLLDCAHGWAATSVQGQLLCDPLIGLLSEEIACSLPEVLCDGVEACGEGKGLACLPWRQVPTLGAGAGKRHGAPASTSERLWGHRLCRVLCVATRMSSAGVPCCLTDCNSLSGNHGTPVGHAPCHLRGAHSTLLMRIQCADSWFPSNRQVLTPDTT